MQKMAKFLIFHLNIANVFIHYQELQVMSLSYKKMSPPALRKILLCSSHFFPFKILSKECIYRKVSWSFRVWVFLKLFNKSFSLSPCLGCELLCLVPSSASGQLSLLSFTYVLPWLPLGVLSCTGLMILLFEVPQFKTQPTKHTRKGFV